MKVAWQPASQSCPIDSREPEARVGKMWTCRACGGRPGTSRRPVWVDCMVAWLGRSTEMPLAVGFTFVTGMVVWTRLLCMFSKKWAVAPVSATICECCLIGCVFNWFSVWLSRVITLDTYSKDGCLGKFASILPATGDVR